MEGEGLSKIIEPSPTLHQTGHATNDFIELQRRTACLLYSYADTRVPSSVRRSGPTVR
jgi:hypothetical protein